MRYYSRSTDDGRSLVAKDAESAYDLTAAVPDLETYGDLARASAIADESVDELASAHFSDATELDPEQVEEEAGLPVVPDEVWAAGVTYQISEEARESESGMPEVYLDVYEGERPELFLKATPSRTVGPADAIGIRADSEWDVPEPELGVVLHRGEIVGYTVGNDVSSRSIEGENPLYLPQAKVYDRCCALGPCVTSAEAIDDPHDLTMTMEIVRDGETVFEDSTTTGEMVKTCEELVSYLTRHNQVPESAVLLTGTGLVPDEEFTLHENDVVSIEIEQIGTLENTVTTV